MQAKLESACIASAKEPAFTEAMKKQGTEARFLGRKDYAEWLKKNDDLNKDIARDTGLMKR